MVAVCQAIDWFSNASSSPPTKPVTCAQWYRPLAIEITAMMRRNRTSRRVHALSSGSIRSDEIAATDMALSRDWSRAEVSDIGWYLGIGAHEPERGPYGPSLGPP